MDRSNATIFTPLQSSRTDTPYVLRLTAIILLITTLTFVITRALSNRYAQSHTVDNDGAKTVPGVPYWIPLLGHIPNMAIDADGFVKGLRQTYSHGAFALNFFGTRHNVVYTPGLATALLNQKAENANAEDTIDYMLETVFGLPKKDFPVYYESRTEILACYKHLLSEPSLSEMVDETAKRVGENIANLVSFAVSPVDEMPWEREAQTNTLNNANGGEIVEASLLPLILHFCANMAIPTLVGSDFLSNFPDTISNLCIMDRGLLLIGAGLPRWLPVPRLTRAHIARKKNLDSICAFHQALEKHANGQSLGPEWQSLDDVGSLVKARMEVYRKYGWSIPARAAIEHSLLWAANANSNSLVFWMLNRIYSDRGLLSRIRSEVEPYVNPYQPQQDPRIAEPPRLANFDVDGLCEKCPLLKSCYIECLRLDTASWSLKIVKQDFVLQAREKESQAWTLKKVPRMICTTPIRSISPIRWCGKRTAISSLHLRGRQRGPRIWVRSGRTVRIVLSRDISKRESADNAIGGGSSMCKGRSFAFKECMAFVAAIVSLWDIEPVGGGEWKMPAHRKASGVYGTDDDTRVRIKRRELGQPVGLEQGA